MNWDEYFDYETDVDYVMGKDGYLINPAKPEKKENNENEQTTKEKTKRTTPTGIEKD